MKNQQVIIEAGQYIVITDFGPRRPSDMPYRFEMERSFIASEGMGTHGTRLSYYRDKRQVGRRLNRVLRRVRLSN